LNSSQPSLRYLGPGEAYFWLSHQNSAKHFVLAAEISGATSIEAWQSAFAGVQQRHPLLQHGIDTDDQGLPFFRLLPHAAIPVRVIADSQARRWEQEVEHELSVPIPTRDSLLARFVLLHGPSRSVVLLTLHHAIGDGLSASYIIRDLLHALGGESLAPLSMPQYQEKLLPPQPAAVAEAGLAEVSVPSRLGSLLNRSETLRVQSLRLSPELTSRVREYARMQNATVHGALVAALTLAGRSRHTPWQDETVRIVSPVNNRPHIGDGEDCRLSIVFPVGAYALDTLEDFWSIARNVVADLAPFRTPQGLGTIFGGYRQLIASNPGVHGIAAFELQMCACEAMLSNLGELPFETPVGGLKLEALWGPAVFVGIEGEQMIGVATVNGVLHLLHSSYSPIEGLLEGVQEVLSLVV